MAINWITPSGIIINDYEETELKDIIIEVEPSEVIVELISGELPYGVSLYKIRDGRYGLSGSLPIVSETTSYYFTLRASLNEEYSDRYFEIIIKNKSIEWDSSQPDTFVFSETSYVSQQLKLLNATGEETFFKISGELPNGLTLNKSGLIYGIAEEVPEELMYYFKIGVKKDDTIILEKDFSIKIIKLSSLKEPIWITESGLIGTLNYKQVSDMLVKAYDPNDLPIIYKLGETGYLPTGLSLNADNGRIEGQLNTEYSQDWNFNIIVSNGAYEVSRDFMISTNVISEENDITWITEPMLGQYKIGENILIKLEVKTNYPAVFSLVTDTLPTGLSFNSQGEIIGLLDYQELGTHSFIIEANNGYKTIQRTFTFEIIKGLGKNSVKSYFYINHEYDSEYNSLVGTFDRNTAYDSSNPLYKINTHPEIDICTLTCFDKTLLKQMLYFNKQLNIIWENTIRKNYIQNDNIIYSAFYKSLREETSTGGTVTINGDKIYILSSKTSPTGYINEYTKEPVEVTGTIHTEKRDGLRYIIYLNRKIYIEILNNNQYYEKDSLEVVDYTTPIYIEEYTYQNEVFQRKYIVKNNMKYEVLQAEDGMIMDSSTKKYMELNVASTTIYQDNPSTRYYFIENDSTTLALSSTSEIRDILNQKIYVEKNQNNNVLYDLGTQEIVSENPSYPEYTIYWDEERQTYYAVYNGEKIYMNVYAISKDDPSQTAHLVYASWEREGYNLDIDGGIASTESFEDVYNAGDAATTDFKEIIDGNFERYVIQPVQVYTEYLNTDVDYKQYLVYEKGTKNLQENIIFTLSWNPSCQFIILNGQVHHIGKIDKPWMYIPEKNENIGYPTKIVLPYINDEDIKDINSLPYVQFFDSTIETLPAWKTKTIPEWEMNYSYITGDVLTYNGIFYVVIQNFTSTGVFDETNMRRMSETEVSDYTKAYYFPTLDLFYSQPNTNLLALSNLNSIENKGGYWTGRKFVFFEVHFKPMYNSNIDNFSVDFYNHKDNRTPEFQLI